MCAWILSRTALKTVSVAVCSCGFGYFTGRNKSSSSSRSSSRFRSWGEKTILALEDWNLTGKSLLFPHVYAACSQRRRRSRSRAGASASDPNVDENNNELIEPAQLEKYGYPSKIDLRTFNDFILSYDKRNRNANWVLEHLTRDRVACSGIRRCDIDSTFQEDQTLHRSFRATNEDFRNSGYDRGHLAASANHRHSLDAMSETYILSNISPQVGEGFNHDGWNDLEIYTRNIVGRSKNVYVLTGPLYLPSLNPQDNRMYVTYEVIGSNHISVPTHFFKVLLIETLQGDFELQSFILPNIRQNCKFKAKDWFVTLESIENAAGLSIFDGIPRERLRKVNNQTVGRN